MNPRSLLRSRIGAPWLIALMVTGLPLSAVQAQAPASASAPRPADYIVAVVNAEPITNSEVRARLARVQQQLAQERTPAPPRAELVRQVLERLIAERAQVQAARQAGLKVDEGAVDDAERSVARQNGIDVAELRRRLAADGIAQASFREDLRSQILMARMRERETDGRVRVSEAEIDQFLRDQVAAPSRFTQYD